MILNYKEAIEFLVDSAEEIGFNRHTIRNLHALLAENVLAETTHDEYGKYLEGRKAEEESPQRYGDA